jgi:nucleoside triphosphate pyrophosphatase
MIPVPRLVLASASPARRRLLEQAGIPAEVTVSGVDESLVAEPDPAALSLILARLKAEAVAARSAGDLLVLGCDSVLEFAGQPLGKPADAAEAAQRWYAMRGRSGVLHTGHSVIRLRPDGAEEARAEAVGSTRVHFADLTDEEIGAYVGTGEPLHVAGAFTIDGRGAPFIESIEGDHGNVIGLSLPLLRRLLAKVGTELTALWRTG